MEPWHVSIGYKTSAPIEEELVFEISSQLGHMAAVVSLSQDFMASAIALTVDANTWEGALKVAKNAVRETLQDLGIEAVVTSVMLQNEDAFQQELREPVYPEVVGYAEIAKMAGLSRQRIRQLAEKPVFPKPVIRTAQGPLYSAHAVERWLEERSSSQHIA